jgi:lysophospholipase L1-like esterase
VASMARLLVSAYESEQALRIASGGPRLYPKAGLPIAANTPVLTMSTTDPAVDADVAQQIVYTIDSTSAAIDPIPKAALKKKRWIRNFSEALRAYKFGVSLRPSTSIQLYNSAGNNGLDTTTWGIYGACVVSEFWLDGDVFFMNQQGGALVSNFEMYVNDAMVNVAPGDANLTLSGSRSYQCNLNGFVKVKFSTSARRKIKVVFSGPLVPTSFRFRRTNTVTPVVDVPLRWMHFGDSFSVSTNASAPTLGLHRWMVEEFGDKFDLINAASGGTGFCNGGSVLVGQTPANGNGSSFRYNWRLNAATLDPYNVITALVAFNDASASDRTLVASECRAMLTEMISHSPKAIICIFACNAGTTNISNGTAVQIENVIKAVCAEFPSVLFFPLQTWDAGPWLRGTGNTVTPTGDGNLDLYSDGTHPPDAGHQAWGEMMARRIYEAAKALV